LVNRRKQTTKKAAFKKQLEAIARHEVKMTAGSFPFFPDGVYDYAEGKITWTNVLFPRKNCTAASLLDVSGLSFTGDDGKRVLLLSAFVCFSRFTALAEPINVVATPKSERPFFLTTTCALNANASDLQITVFAWDANGDAAPNVGFDWRCRVVSVPMFLSPTLHPSSAERG
jgi:hypothetical protein